MDYRNKHGVMHIGIVIVVAVLSACAAPSSPHHVVLLTDRSASIEPGDGSSCGAIVGLFRNALDNLELDGRSTITILATGDKSSMDSPVILLAAVAVPYTARALEGRDGVIRQRMELLEDVAKVCDREMRATRVSPIFLGMQVSIGQLRASGCLPTGRCTLLIQSDMRETQEGSVVNALRGEPIDATAPSLAAEGIDVLVCGQAQQKPIADGESLSAASLIQVQETWSRLLATARSVQFMPLCPSTTKDPATGNRSLATFTISEGGTQ